MSFSAKLLPALALAVALSPLAAQARVHQEPRPVVYYLAPLHNDRTAPAQNVLHKPGNLTVVQGGVTANAFPDSFGG